MKIISEFPNYSIAIDGVIVNNTNGKKIAICVHKHGYHVVRLWSNNTTKLKKIYRLLAEAYIPNPESKREVNHIDGNRMNFSLSNLEWVTASENMKHAYRNGLSRGTFKSGFDHQLCKLKPEDVLYIIEKRKNKEVKLKDLAVKFGVTPYHICRVSKGKTHGYLQSK